MTDCVSTRVGDICNPDRTSATSNQDEGIDAASLDHQLLTEAIGISPAAVLCFCSKSAPAHRLYRIKVSETRKPIPVSADFFSDP